jgi:outer membrane lipoprotein-sorting protein
MKRIIGAVVLLLGIGGVAIAQPEVKAKAILAAVSKKYATYNIIKSDFTYTLESPQAKINQTYSGTLYTKAKTNKYKVILQGQELISDGKTQWTYLKADKEVQLNTVDSDPNAINPAKIFTIYEKGFKYLYVSDTKINGRVNNIIELVPTDSKRSFFKVRLTIDQATKQISNAVIFDKNGSKYTYTMKAFNPNFKATESIFAFDARQYPGVEVVDLR